MKLVILAGGRGTRISEETLVRPKPLVEIGGLPIIWHIMKIYSHYGFNEFVICCGYKGYMIKEYFSNYGLHTSDTTIDLKNKTIKVHKKTTEKWKITLIDTGENTLTGGRILRIKDYVGENFCLTYGDGLANVNIKKLLDHHKKNKKISTVTVVQPTARFGTVELDKNMLVKKFLEKSSGDSGWINGGFFVLNKKIFKYIKNDQTIFEKEPLENLSKQKQLTAFKHKGFWQPMDTLREKEYLEELWNSNKAPWKVW
jgi:glucose-1-phosphate cytidylyltransferase